MNFKPPFILFMLTTLCWGEGIASEKVQVIYHIGTADPHQQQAAILNIENHLVDIRAKQLLAKIKILMDREGSLFFKRAADEPQFRKQLVALHQQGVQVLLEESALSAQEKSEYRQLINQLNVEWVDHAVLSLVNLQQQGYAYIPYVAR